MRPRRVPPALALAWSEATLASDDRLLGPPALALWRPAGTTAAVGLAQKPEVELDVEAMRADSVPLVRRQSGGGAVLLYDGVLCWEAWASAASMGGENGIRQSYAFLSGPVKEALRGLGLDVFQAGICDLSLAKGTEKARKLAGTAQLRRRDMVLVHGSLLLSPDLSLLSRYLRFPSEQPEYRRGRPHRDFCVSVSEALQWTGGADALLETVTDAVHAAAEAAGWDVLEVPETLTPEAALLAERKYGAREWNWSRVRDWA